MRTMIHRMYLVAFFVLMASPVGAQQPTSQRLLETDGIELHGTSQVVGYAAGTCNVLETDTLYEEKKANHDAPMDIWRLDFSVHNRSGKWLDHLIARYEIDSEWPQCTNWDKAGLREPLFVEWADVSGNIQKSGRNVVAPDEILTETRYIIVLQGDPPPRFVRWSMDFDFGATSTRAPTRPTPPQATPEQENLFWQSIMDSANPAEFEAYLEQFPNGVFRALAEARLEALRAPVGDRPADGPRGGGTGAPVTGSRTAPDRDAPPRAGELKVFDRMEFVRIPAGEFRMGSTSPEADDDEQPVTQVRISRGFWLGKHEVTQAEWQGLMGTNPSRSNECGMDCPADSVSWEDAQEFIRRLNAMDGAGTYRLPTEAEWEYAARAGTTGVRYGNVDAIAWHDASFGTHPVGQKAPNAWGLYDMLGNVEEWVADWYGDYPGGVVTDPPGPGAGSYRLHRGSSWANPARDVRASHRSYNRPVTRSMTTGFRLLRTE